MSSRIQVLFSANASHFFLFLEFLWIKLTVNRALSRKHPFKNYDNIIIIKQCIFPSRKETERS